MNEVELQRDQWHARWFKWSAQVLDEFWPLILFDRPPRTFESRDGTNLCRYLRILVLGGVVVPAMHICLVLLWAAALFIYPIYVFGLYDYSVVIGSVAGIIASIAAAITVVVFGWKLLKAGATRAFDHVDHAVTNWERTHEKRGPGLASVLWQHVVAQHNKICLKVTFTNSNNTENRHV